MIYTLDTNVLIDAMRYPSEMVLLKAFLEWALPHTVLSSVVASELLAGARTETATIDAALDLVVFRTEVFTALDRVADDGGFAPAGRGRRAG